MREFITQKLIVIMCVSLLLIFIAADQVSGYSATLSYYDGFDLDTGTIENDPMVLVIIVGSPEDVEEILEIEGLADPFDFSPQVDFHFEFDSDALNPIVLVPEEMVKIAFLDNTSFDDVDFSTINTLDFIGYDDLTEFTFNMDMGDTAVLLTAESAYFKIGNIYQNPDWTVSVEYEIIPEPSTIVLLGFGSVVLIWIVMRKKIKTNSSFLFSILFISIVLLSAFTIVGASSSTSAQVFSCNDVTEIPQPHCEMRTESFGSYRR